jgi:hypothetical protein
VSSLEDFRRDLKQIHLLEEEMSRVKRDREILVTRLIKTTKTRPTKSDIKAMADTLAPRDGGSVLSSDMSIYSHNSDVSVNNREAKRASKLAEAQAELLGCEEHLRSLEVRVENERNKVMYRGLEERFRAMEAVGQMWMNQARRGLSDLDKLPDLPQNAFELESNGSIAPSQSASQVGYEEAPAVSMATPSKRSSNGRHVTGMRAPEVMNGSIAEEEEGGGSSDDEPQGTLVMHTNAGRPQVNTNMSHANGNGTAPRMSSPLRTSPIQQQQQQQPHSSPRRATSDIGAMAPYNPPRRSHQLRRTVSNDNMRPPGSDVSSVRHDGKKRGFFSSIARFFKGSKPAPHHGRSGRASPTRGTWTTRTDSNIRSSGAGGRRRVRSDSSSDEDDMSRFVAVSNNGATEFGGWSVADVGREPSTSRPGVKRSSSSRSKSTVVSQSTVTARARPFSPTLPPPTNVPSVSRSSTLKTTKSATAGEKTRKNGSIARSKSARSAAGTDKNIMSIVDMPPPAMPDVPRAPQSQLNPRMELAKAPGSSMLPSHSGPAPMLLPSQMVSSISRRHEEELRPSDSISRSNSTRTSRSTKSKTEKLEKRRSLAPPEKPAPQSDPEAPRSVSPLPPSKMRSPPLKSALRPTSPNTPRRASPPPVITSLYSISAPGPVELPFEPELEPEPRPSLTRNRSGDETSIYESAEEDNIGDETDDDEETELGGYTVVANEIATVADGYAIPHERIQHLPTTHGPDPILASVPTAPGPGSEEVKLGRRKSVRIAEDEDGTSHDVEDREPVYKPRERDFAPEPAVISTAAPPRPARRNDDSPPPTRSHATWDTRIGRMRDDSSDEEEDRDTKDYTRARKGLIKNNGDFSDAAAMPKKKKKGTGGDGLKKSFSLKSMGSRSAGSLRR